MIVFNDGVKGGFEEGFNFGFDVWDNHGKKPRSNVEACTIANGFKLEVRRVSYNVILKFSP